MKQLLAITTLVLALGLPGCRSVPVQVAPGADPIVVAAEWAAENAALTIDQYLAWERAHETELLATEPGKAWHAFAEELRRTAPGRVRELRAATVAYQAAKNDPNGSRVKSLTELLLKTANAVRVEMGLPPLQPPEPVALPPAVGSSPNTP